MNITKQNTETHTIEAESLSNLLLEVSKYIDDNEFKSVWTITIQPSEDDLSVDEKWFAIVTILL